MTAKFCPECGEKTPDGAKFCDACGAKLGASRRDATIRGEASAENVAGGEVAGVRVGQVTAQTARFEADVIQVKLSDEQAKQLARAMTIPTEVQAPGAGKTGGLSGKLAGMESQIAAMKGSIDQALAKLAQSDATTVRAGGVEASRADLLVKKAILLTSEADQMVFDRARESRERAQLRGGAAQVDLGDVFSNWPGMRDYEKKLADAKALFEEAALLEPTDAEILLHLFQATDRVADDERAAASILYRVQRLLENPKNDVERFQLAQATYLLAVAGGVPQPQQIRTARAAFAKLGRDDWARLCDEQLGASRAAAPSADPPPLPTVDAPFQPQGADAPFHPVGRWQVTGSDGSVVLVELRPEGSFQGAHQGGPYMGTQVVGQWGFDPMRSLLQLQGIANGMMPFVTLLAIQGQQGGLYLGQDATGVVVQLRRIG